MRKSILFLFAIVCAAFMAAQEQLPKWEKQILTMKNVTTHRAGKLCFPYSTGRNKYDD